MAKKRIYQEHDTPVTDAYNEISDELHDMFQRAQGEAYDKYCAWEAKQVALDE